MGDPDSSIVCERCHSHATLINKAPLARNTGGRRFPRFIESLGRSFDSASEYRRALKNPTDFKGRPRSLPDGTMLQFHEV